MSGAEKNRLVQSAISWFTRRSLRVCVSQRREGI